MPGRKAVVQVIFYVWHKIQLVQAFKIFFRAHNIRKHRMLERLCDERRNNIRECHNDQPAVPDKQQDDPHKYRHIAVPEEGGVIDDHIRKGIVKAVEFQVRFGLGIHDNEYRANEQEKSIGNKKCLVCFENCFHMNNLCCKNNKKAPTKTAGACVAKSDRI